MHMNTVRNFIDKVFHNVRKLDQGLHLYFNAEEVAHTLGYENAGEMIDKLKKAPEFDRIKANVFYHGEQYLTEADFYNAVLKRGAQMPATKEMGLWLDRPFDAALAVRIFYEYVQNIYDNDVDKCSVYVDGHEFLPSDEWDRIYSALFGLNMEVFYHADALERTRIFEWRADKTVNVTATSTMLQMIRFCGGYAKGMEWLSPRYMKEIMLKIQELADEVSSLAYHVLHKNAWDDALTWTSYSYSAFSQNPINTSD